MNELLFCQGLSIYIYISWIAPARPPGYHAKSATLATPAGAPCQGILKTEFWVGKHAYTQLLRPFLNSADHILLKTGLKSWFWWWQVVKKPGYQKCRFSAILVILAMGERKEFNLHFG